MDGGRQAADEVVDKCYPIADARCWEALLPREEQSFFLLGQPELFQHVDVLIGDLGSLPSRDLEAFRRHGGLWRGVP